MLEAHRESETRLRAFSDTSTPGSRQARSAIGSLKSVVHSHISPTSNYGSLRD